MDIRQLQEQAWSEYLGCMNPSRFVEAAREEGVTVEALLDDYIRELPNLFEDFEESDLMVETDCEPLPLRDLLLGYIEREG